MILRDFLLVYLDVSLEALNFFDVRGYYRKPIKEYKRWREKNKIATRDIYHFKKLGYLRNDSAGNFELTEKALAKLNKIAIENIRLEKIKIWDKKWRVVFFDIPEKKKTQRELFRKKLKELDFEYLQKSVFCYPHDCLKELSMIIKTYEIEPYVTYMEVTNIITGKNLVKIFSDKQIINI